MYVSYIYFTLLLLCMIAGNTVDISNGQITNEKCNVNIESGSDEMMKRLSCNCLLYIYIYIYIKRERERERES